MATERVAIRCEIACGDPAILVAAAESAIAIVGRTTHHRIGFVGSVTVHNLADFRAADTRINKRPPRPNLGFASALHHEAHIAFEPLLTADLMRQVGTPSHLVRTVAHEATHLATYAAGADALPFWMGDGFAEFVAARVVRSLGYAVAADGDPWTGEQVLTMREVMSAMSPQAFDTLWTRDANSASLVSYAGAAMLYEWLVAEHAPLVESLWQGAYVAPLARVNPITTRMDGAGLSFAAFRAYLNRQPVGWRETQRHIAFGRDTIQQATGREAFAWRWPYEGHAYRLHAEADQLAGLAAIVLSAPPFEYTVTVVGGNHPVIMQRNTIESTASHSVAVGLLTSPPASQKLSFDVDVDSGIVRAKFADVLLAFRDPRFGGTTRWGLRTTARGLVRWSGIRVEPLPPH